MEKRAKEIANKRFPTETVREQLPVLMSNLGDLAQSVVYVDFYKDKTYLVYAEHAIADLLFQLAVVCGRLDFNFEKLCGLGFTRFIDKMEHG
jgi:hypothetical protein